MTKINDDNGKTTHSHFIDENVNYPNVTKHVNNIENIRDFINSTNSNGKTPGNEDQYKRLFSEMINGIAIHEIITDDTGKAIDYRFIAVNPAFELMTGLSAANIIGKRVLEVLPETEHYWIDTYGKVALNNEEVHFEEYSSGLDKYFEVVAYSHHPGQFATILQDITDKKRMADECESLSAKLIHSQKMESIGRLAGGVAHDFNNMLSAIIGYTELSLMKISSDDEIHEYLSEISKAANRSADLTRQLLAFARQQIVDPQIVNLNEIIKSMLNMLHRLIGENVKLTWLPSDNLWQINIDPSQIDQILANMIVNARDAINDIGEITIETTNIIISNDYCTENIEFSPGKYVLLSITDTGCGIPDEIIKVIFDPFFTTKEVGTGTGLGLSTVYGIVKQNNGYINVYTELNKGTTFKIYLPAFDIEINEIEKRTKTNRTGKETILLVEDEQSILELTTQILERLGYIVLPVRLPENAIKIVKNSTDNIDLLMTDIIPKISPILTIN
jgi:PAS domain S-box-containing protein